ncbi:MAG: AAA family ATPase [Ignisphaera sp.]
MLSYGTLCKVVIVLAGLPGAGKSVVANVARELGLPVVSLGDVVREEVAQRGLEPTLENILNIANELRRKFGKDAIAKLALDRIARACSSSCIVIVDGVRSLDEIETIGKQVDKKVFILAIHSSQKTRFERILARGRQGDPRTLEDFRRRDLEELSWGLGNVIALADKIIINEGRIEELISETRNFFIEVLKSWCT